MAAMQNHALHRRACQASICIIQGSAELELPVVSCLGARSLTFASARGIASNDKNMEWPLHCMRSMHRYQASRRPQFDHRVPLLFSIFYG
jgi:hypothetical protein